MIKEDQSTRKTFAAPATAGAWRRTMDAVGAGCMNEVFVAIAVTALLITGRVHWKEIYRQQTELIDDARKLGRARFSGPSETSRSPGLYCEILEFQLIFQLMEKRRHED